MAAETKTKKSFVLANPGLPARQLIKIAADKGIKLTESYIYIVRSEDRRRPPEGTPEDVFRRIALHDLGLNRARGILTELERQI